MCLGKYCKLNVAAFPSCRSLSAGVVFLISCVTAYFRSISLVDYETCVPTVILGALCCRPKVYCPELDLANRESKSKVTPIVPRISFSFINSVRFEAVSEIGILRPVPLIGKLSFA